MRKTYLNRQERTNYIFACALLSKAQEIIEEIEQHGGDRTAVRYMKTGCTWITKGLREWTKGVERRTMEQILREGNRYTAGIVWHKDAEKHTKTMAAQDIEMRQKVVQELGGDPIYDLAEIVLALKCRTCDGSIRDCCFIHETFDKLDIPEWDDNRRCRYAGCGEGGNE